MRAYPLNSPCQIEDAEIAKNWVTFFNMIWVGAWLGNLLVRMIDIGKTPWSNCHGVSTTNDGSVWREGL